MTLVAQLRPVRNNNPGDLDRGEPWRGLMPRTMMNPMQAAEDRFCVFLSPAWGFRALTIVLGNYGRLYGDRTVRSIVTRFAPPGENDTAAYIRDVWTAMGVDPDTQLNLHDATIAQRMCRAIAVKEAGGWFFDGQKDLEAGVMLALNEFHGRIARDDELGFTGKRHLFERAA